MAFRADDADSNTYARFPVEVLPNLVYFTAADTTVAKQICTNSTTTLGYRVDLITVSSNEDTGRILKLYLHNGTSLSTLPFAFCALPSDSGVGGVSDATSVLRSTNLEPIVSLDNNGNPYLMLGVGWSIYAALNTTLTAGKTIQVLSMSHSY